MADDVNLAHKKCVACEQWTASLKGEKLQGYLKQLKLPWEVMEEKKIHHQFKFKDFRQAMKFVNQVADIANEEDHHPDICIFYNKVDITLWTHFIKGLHENDFILAAKIEKLTQE